MKRLAALVLTLVMVSGLLTGCGSKEKDYITLTITASLQTIPERCRVGLHRF